MAEPTVEELQRIARETFGRELSPEQAESYRGRLPTMDRAVRTLRAWAGRLWNVEPAPVYRVPVEGEDGDGAA